MIPASMPGTGVEQPQPRFSRSYRRVVSSLTAARSYIRTVSTCVDSGLRRVRILLAGGGVSGRGPGMDADQELHTQTSAGAGLAERAEPASRLAEGIARGAVVVASLTILSRILGLVRTLVFSQTVGASCLGTSYVTANQVPDLLYQLILGGALTSAMIPVLARSAERASTGTMALLSAPPRIS